MLNNREWALIIWAELAFVLILSRGRYRRAVYSFLRVHLTPIIATLVTPVLLVPLLVVVGNVVLLCALMSRIGLWDAALLKDTVYWFFGPALAFFFRLEQAQRDPHAFHRAAISILKFTLVLEFLVNFYVFSIPVEFVLQPLFLMLVLLELVSGTKAEFASAKRLVERLSAFIGILLVIYVSRQLIVGWEDVDLAGSAREIVLPIWLSLGITPLMYGLTLYVSYDWLFRRVAVGVDGRWSRWRTRLAILSCRMLRSTEVASLPPFWLGQLAESSSFRDARVTVFAARDAVRESARQERLQRARLIWNAGRVGSDESGHQVDQREFEETRRSFQWLWTVQIGQYQNRGEGYRPDALAIVQSTFERYGLATEHGTELHVSPDRDSWWAWRRTITGWCFAIGMGGPPGSPQWLYDGPEPPSGFPGQDDAWGEPWGMSANNWG
jgi:hypothetical protein